MEERVTELELRYDRQADLVEQLDALVTRLQQDLLRAEARIDRLERTLEDVMRVVVPPPNEKPPHY